MKVSELIKELQSIIDAEGDINVTWSNEWDINDLDYLDSIVSIETDDSCEKYLDINTN